MSTAPLSSPSTAAATAAKIGTIGAIADAVLKPISGADDTSQGAQTVAGTVDMAAQIAEVAVPQYKAEIQLAESLEPVAYHAGLALAHLIQHWLHHTTSQPTK